MRVKQDLLSELYDVFYVRQVTRGTELEKDVAVDLVYLPPNKVSQKHKHNISNTILLFLDGVGMVGVGSKLFAVKKDDRIHIPPGVFHWVQTENESLHFLSVQTPPILSKEEDHLDLEYAVNS